MTDLKAKTTAELEREQSRLFSTPDYPDKTKDLSVIGCELARRELQDWATKNLWNEGGRQ